MRRGSIILAAVSFVIGAAVFSLMLYTLILEEQLQTINDKNSVVLNNVTSHHAVGHHAFGLHVDKTSIDLIISLVLLFSILSMIFSILLLIGIKKNKPSLVVAYFSFGSLLCLLLLVCTVLELLHCLWYAAITTAIISFILMERLSTVYSVYEDMQKNSDAHHLLDEDQLNEQDAIDNIIVD